ncbi:protein NAP1 isoform X1 [Selaginella moellendorffii]|uniref:protein NAP1 isoform X1 n=2 Tax=Selaginella moellendorffii TaxID=88036 RepID=UPI000D1CBC99|nr:protein NAP1 isoform X1 [Selaginella moellendorffii]|eukprot:XP_024527538.1 protein NAP1 isoform X1 [Selaginella moellendorffii]
MGTESQLLEKKLQGFSRPDIRINSPDKHGSDWDDVKNNESSSAAASPSTSSPHWKKAMSSSPAAGRGYGAKGSSAVNAQKFRQIEWVFQLQDVAEGLMTKIYRLREILELNDNGNQQFSDAFWQSGLFPNAPKLCTHLLRKFPEHPVKLLPEKVDKPGLDLLRDNAESYLTALEPWLLVLLDLMTFREQALRVILDMSSTVVTLMPHQNPIVLHAFMNLFCAFVKVNLYADKIPRKMLLQLYNLTHTILKSGRDYEFYHRLVQFVDSFDPPLKGLHEDLNFVSHRVGEILDAIGPTIYLGSDFERIRSEGFLSPYHPRYPEKLTNSAHPARAQELANIYSYREWVLLGYLVCPSELLRIGAIDIVMAVLKNTLVLPLFRDEYLSLHEEYQHSVLPKISESRKLAKVGRVKQKDADVEYNLAKQVEKTIIDAHDVAILQSDGIHREHRVTLKLELRRMIVFFTDQPSLLAPNVQMAYAALAVARAEALWYFSHAGLVVGRAKGNRVMPVTVDPSDHTIGYLLKSMDKLIVLIRKYASAIRAFSLGHLTGIAQRMRLLFESPGAVALDFESDLRNSFLAVMERLETLPKLQTEKLRHSNFDLSVFRQDWLRIIMTVSSSRSSINFRHLEKATISTGKDSIITEGNMAYVWSRSVDDMQKVLSQHGSLKTLCFYREHLNMVFRHTMYGPEGRPHNCCAWLSIASTFPENAHYSVADEPAKLAEDAISYAETLLNYIMKGFEGLINLLDSEEGFGRLDQQLLPEQAASRLNQVARAGFSSNKSVRVSLDLPGFESKPSNKESMKLIDAAVQRLTTFCSVINEMEPVRVVNHVFVPREYMRDRILGNFRSQLLKIPLIEKDLQRPSVIEASIQRHMTIIHIIEQHVGMDLTQSVREVLLKEAISGHPQTFIPNYVPDAKVGGSAASTICDWYIENIIKDVNNVGVIFTPSEKSFRSARPVGKTAAHMVADVTELKAFVRIFGPYGADKLDNDLREQLAVLLNCIDITLRSNKEALENLATSLHSKRDRDAALKSMTELETLMNFSLQAGHILSFRCLLAEAASQVLESSAPLLASLVSDFARHAPPSFPEKPAVSKVKMLACQFGASKDQDSKVVQSILLNLGGAGDSTWALVPYLYVALMTSSVWDDSSFDIHAGGFNNNVHCLARCIHAVVAASELVRFERRELQRRMIAQQHPERKIEDSDSRILENIEMSIKAMMKTFLQGAAVTALDLSSDGARGGLVAKLIFLDQLCDLSSYLPRSTLEACIPRSMMRSIYQSYYENSVPTLMTQSRRHGSSFNVRNGQVVPESHVAEGILPPYPRTTATATTSRAFSISTEAGGGGGSSNAPRKNERFSGPMMLDPDGKKASFTDPSSTRKFAVSSSRAVQA